MLALFKLGFEVVLFFLVLGVGFYAGAKVEQKWPGKVSQLFAFLSPKSTTSTNS